MASAAVAGLGGRVLHLGGGVGHEVIVALPAEFDAGLDQQRLVRGSVRRVARGAFAGVNWLVNRLRALAEVIVAGVAEGWAWLGQETLALGSVWIMAGDTFAILNWLMLDLGSGVCQEIVMAVPAE